MESQVIKKIKGIFFVDCLADDSVFSDDDYGVFFTGSLELGIEGHCYFYGSNRDAKSDAEERNELLKDRGYLD